MNWLKPKHTKMNLQINFIFMHFNGLKMTTWWLDHVAT
jgi:hypothetical protein